MQTLLWIPIIIPLACMLALLCSAMFSEID